MFINLIAKILPCDAESIIVLSHSYWYLVFKFQDLADAIYKSDSHNFIIWYILY